MSTTITIVLIVIFVLLVVVVLRRRLNHPAPTTDELNITFDPKTIKTESIEYHVRRIENAKKYTDKPHKLAEFDAWLEYYNNLLVERRS